MKRNRAELGATATESPAATRALWWRDSAHKKAAARAVKTTAAPTPAAVLAAASAAMEPAPFWPEMVEMNSWRGERCHTIRGRRGRSVGVCMRRGGAAACKRPLIAEPALLRQKKTQEMAIPQGMAIFSGHHAMHAMKKSMAKSALPTNNNHTTPPSLQKNQQQQHPLLHRFRKRDRPRKRRRRRPLVGDAAARPQEQRRERRQARL